MAINTEDTKNSLFGGLSKAASREVKNSSTSIKPNTVSSGEFNLATQEVICANSVVKSTQGTVDPYIPKWQTFEKVTVLLTTDQRDAVEEFSRKIMRQRKSKLKDLDSPERITSNSIIRAILDNAIERIKNVETPALANEESLKIWMSALFK